MEPKQRRVVIAMDESIHSEQAFDWYMKSFKRPSDHVILVHCVQRHDSFHAALGASDVKTVAIILAQEEQEEKVLQERLQIKLKTYQLTGCVKVGFGRPGDVIVSTAEKEQADTIICGTRGHGKIRRTILGSVSDYIIHHSHVPVIVCRNENTSSN